MSHTRGQIYRRLAWHLHTFAGGFRRVANRYPNRRDLTPRTGAWARWLISARFIYAVSSRRHSWKSAVDKLIIVPAHFLDRGGFPDEFVYTVVFQIISDISQMQPHLDRLHFATMLWWCTEARNVNSQRQKSASVINSFLVGHSTLSQPSFDLLRRQLSL